MVVFRGRHGSDGKAELIDGFEVLLGGRVVGFIWPGGTLSKSYPEGSEVEYPDAILTKSETSAIWKKCSKVRKMPSEYGWIGVG